MPLVCATLAATNGTYVNGERIQGTMVLADGDQVSIGKLQFQVLLKQTAPVAADAPAESADALGCP